MRSNYCLSTSVECSSTRLTNNTPTVAGKSSKNHLTTVATMEQDNTSRNAVKHEKERKKT